MEVYSSGEAGLFAVMAGSAPSLVSPMPVKLQRAVDPDVEAIFALKEAVADDLTRKFGKGHWSSFGTEAGVARGVKSSMLWVARGRAGVIAVLSLSTKKPWAIDPAYFTACKAPLYLTDMAVAPAFQGQGIGRECLVEARRIAVEHPAGAIRLDAYDAPAGAGAFYAKCGYREVGRAVYKKNPLVYFETLI
jgi:GNAT superfamily N-acetyltransferase